MVEKVSKFSKKIEKKIDSLKMLQIKNGKKGISEWSFSFVSLLWFVTLWLLGVKIMGPYKDIVFTGF